MNHMEWSELESDPGLFTLLLEDFGVKGVQVEEVYDLSIPIPETVYGFIFLFRWDSAKKKSSRRSGRGSTGSASTATTVPLANSSNNPAPVPPANSAANGPSEWKDNTAVAAPASSSVTTTHNNVSGQLRSNAGLPDQSSVPSHATDDDHNNNNNSSSQVGMAQSSTDSAPQQQPPEIFFAHQSVQNSCATHALLSILLNRPGLELGTMLTEFHKATRHLTPEEKGLAIGSMPQLAEAHNRHAAKPAWLVTPSKQQQAAAAAGPVNSTSPYEAAVAAAAVSAALAVASTVTGMTSSSISASCSTSLGASAVVPASSCYQPSSHNTSLVVECSSGTACSSTPSATVSTDTFHFVCYLPIGEQLYELDGLKPEPVNHGSIRDLSTWTDHCVEILRRRMREQDLRYSLLAVVPDRRIALAQRMETLEKNRSIIERILGHHHQTTTTAQLPSPVKSEPHSSPGDVAAGHVLVGKRGTEDAEDPDYRLAGRVSKISEKERGDQDEDIKPFRLQSTATGDGNRPETGIATPQSSTAAATTIACETTRSILTRAASRLASLPPAQQQQQQPTTTTNMVSSVEAGSPADQPTTSSSRAQAPRKREFDSGEGENSSSSQIAGGIPLEELKGEEEAWLLTLGGKRQRLHVPPTSHRELVGSSALSDGFANNNNCSGAPSVHKLFPALSLSAHSPLLTTLTETVAALVGVGSACGEKPTASCGLFRSGSVGEDQSGTTENYSDGQAGSCIPGNPTASRVGSQTEEFFPASVVATSPNVYAQQQQPPGYSDKALTSIHHQLIRPLTIDTSLYNPGDTVANTAGAAGKRKKETPELVDSVHEGGSLRPQTRALTRARGHSSSSSSLLRHCEDKSLRQANSLSSASNGRWSSGSPPPNCLLDMGCSANQWKREAEEFPPGSRTDWTEESFNCAADTEIVTRRVSSTSASKYPTRSSTRRDTLASHSLAHLRSAGSSAVALTTALTVDTTTRTQGNNESAVKHSPGRSRDAQVSSGSTCSQASAVVSALTGHNNHHQNTFSPSESSPAVGSSRGGHTKLSLAVPRRLTACHLQVLLSYVDKQTKDCEAALADEAKKRARYRLDDARRVHNYEPFIRAFLTALSNQGILRTLVLNSLQKKQNSSAARLANQKRSTQNLTGSSLASPRMRSPTNDSVSVSLASTADSSPSSTSVNEYLLYSSPSCPTRSTDTADFVSASRSQPLQVVVTSSGSRSGASLPSSVASLQRLRKRPSNRAPDGAASQPTTRSRSGVPSARFPADEFPADAQLSSSTVETTTTTPSRTLSGASPEGDPVDETFDTGREVDPGMTLQEVSSGSPKNSSCFSDEVVPTLISSATPCINSHNSGDFQSAQPGVITTTSQSTAAVSPNPISSVPPPPQQQHQLSSCLSSFISSRSSPTNVFSSLASLSTTKSHSVLGNCSTAGALNNAASPRRSSRSRYSSPKLTADNSLDDSAGDRSVASSPLSTPSFSVSHSLRCNSRRRLTANSSKTSSNNDNNSTSTTLSGSLRSSMAVKLDRRATFSATANFSHRKRHLC